MPDHLTVIHWLGNIAVIAPAVLIALLGVPALLGISLSEKRINRFVEATLSLAFASAVGLLVMMWSHGVDHYNVNWGNWVSIPHYHFTIKFVLDWLSVPFLILSLFLCGTIGAFASRYMHRERGYGRFFTLYSLFATGMCLASVADTIETLFAGWELVGLSSALLVAFFHERPSPPRNGLRVWVVYRISDAALLLAAVVMHHLTGEGDFDRLMGSGPWPAGEVKIDEFHALIVGFLLIIAAAGKSALVPFSGWLPRAMEGPTPSSAVFYGALSIHLGAYLLLRVSPILQLSFPLTAMVVLLGASTAVFAALASQVQTDIKSSLAFASVTQVGIIVAEIGLGFYYLALIHIIGHACLRTLQLLRAPTLLKDYAVLENAIGGRLLSDSTSGVTWIPESVKLFSYRFAMERGGFDAAIDRTIIHPVGNVFRFFDKCERKWTDLLTQTASRDSDKVPVIDVKEDWA